MTEEQDLLDKATRDKEKRAKFSRLFENWAKDNCPDEKNKDALMSVAWYFYESGWRAAVYIVGEAMSKLWRQIDSLIREDSGR